MYRAFSSCEEEAVEGLLASYYTLQRLFIEENQPDIADRLFREELEPLATGIRTTQFADHLLRLARCYIEYDCSELADKCWQRIVAMSMEESLEEEELKVKAFQAKNERAMMLFNQGLVYDAGMIFTELTPMFMPHSPTSTSKFFETVESGCVICPGLKAGVFHLHLKVKRLSPQTKLVLRVDRWDGQRLDETSHISPSGSYIHLTSRKLSIVPLGVYVLWVEVPSVSNFHRQMCWSGPRICKSMQDVCGM